jgi:CheY-like chemotaxis protein
MEQAEKKLKSILLVDDNEFTNIFNRRFLEKLNIANQVYTARNGKEALEFLRRMIEDRSITKPDLILLDLNMPVMSGWEFIDEYRKLENESKHGKIIVLTTSPNPEDEAKAMSIELVADYIKKPLTKEIVSELIEMHFHIK